VAIPDYLTLMRPLLEALSDGSERTTAELRSAMAEHFHLSDEELAQLLPSGTGGLFHNRVAWANTYLYHARTTERPRRGVYKISERGREMLAQYPDPTEFYRAVEQLPEIVEFRAGSGRSRDARETRPAADETGVPPLERLAQAQTELDDALASDLMARIRESDSTFFERLVLKLLLAMGYGGSEEEAAEHLGRTGDQGVDGVINEDRLGLDRIYIQAKRWGENPARRPEIQAFVGALEGQGASKGVFITASRFTQEAQSYAEGIRQRVILIDGQQLAELMIRHEVGVTTRRVVAVKEVDEDFFADDVLA
jgi:restriction system protein